MKEDYDGAEPAASSVAVGNLLTLRHLTGDAHVGVRSDRTLGRYGARLGQAARVVPMMMAALAHHHAPATQIVIVGASDDDATRALQRVVASRYLPFSVRIQVASEMRQAQLATRLPFIGAMTRIEGRPTAYVCSDFTCREPVTAPAALDAQLRDL